jgi:antitoxin component of RelBE/YafQ-DinJ toxin-antitoxin module
VSLWTPSGFCEEKMARDWRITVRLDEEEYREVEKKAEQLGITKSEFLRLLVLDSIGEQGRLKEEINRALKKSEEWKNIAGNLGRITSYANQIAHSLNKLAKRKKISKRDYAEILKTAEELKTLVRELISGSSI